ncbi:MAG: signal recognition particle-docking protein FtsY [Elainellaceae cyanobacterium]
MSPFNWFNRSKKEPSNQPKADVPKSEAPEPTEPVAEDQAPAAEKLDWAKAAYQTIQKRKAEEAAAAAQDTSDTEADPTIEAEETVPAGDAAEQAEASPVETPQTEATQIEPESAVSESAEAVLAKRENSELDDSESDAVEPRAAELESSKPDSAALDAPVPDAVELESSESDSTDAEATGQDNIEPEAEDEAELEAAPTLPFWAQADAERQQRLEELKATAIDDTPPSTAVESDIPPADVSFDDDFVWSANVLAAQGRRPDDVSIEEINWLTKLRQGLGKTRRSLVNQLRAVVGQGPLNEEAVMEIESLLLQADVGIDATDYIIDAVQNKLKQEALPPDAAIAYLKEILRDILDRPYKDGYSPSFAPKKDMLNVWLLTGVNGAGKTTTIGKLAHLSRKSDYRCLIAAADTFRAAAVEQVKIWGERSGVEVVANPGQNTDPAAVVFDAIAAAQSRSIDVLLVDTAGRLQNKKNLMDELSKIRRIIDKKADKASVESLLVLDATLGQNGLQQAKVFAEAAQLSGVVLTKLDGTAKGGVALAVVQQLGLPIRFIGAGEGIEDLRPFSSYEFVEALLSG